LCRGLLNAWRTWHPIKVFDGESGFISVLIRGSSSLRKSPHSPLSCGQIAEGGEQWLAALQVDHTIYLRARNTRTRATIRTNPQIHIQLLFQPCIPMLYPFTKPPQVAPANGPISNPLNLDRSKSVSSARGIEKPLELRCPESKGIDDHRDGTEAHGCRGDHWIQE